MKVKSGLKTTGSAIGCLLTILIHLAWSIFLIQMVLSFIIKPTMPWPNTPTTYYTMSNNLYQGFQLNPDGTMTHFSYQKVNYMNNGHGYAIKMRVDSQKFYQMFFPLHKYSNLSNPRRIITKDWVMLDGKETAYRFDLTPFDRVLHNMKIEKEDNEDSFMNIIIGPNYVKIKDITYQEKKLPDWIKKDLKMI